MAKRAPSVAPSVASPQAARPDVLSPSALAAAPSVSSTAFYLIHANIAFYAFFWWLSQPVLPYLSKELGADNTIFGWFQSFAQLVQLVGAPVIGRLIDVKGPKLALIISHVCGAASYGLLYASTNVNTLFMSQLPTMAMAAMHSSQAFISYLSSPDDRAKQLGRVSLSYGIGFVLGPLAGGTLSKYIGYQNVSLIGMAGSLGVAVLLAVMLPNIQPTASSTAESGSKDGENKKAAGKAWYSVSAELLSLPTIRSLILTKFFLGLGLSLWRSCFTIVARDTFGLDAQWNGFILSGVGGLTMLVNIAMLGFLTARFSDRSIVTTCVAISGAMLALSGFAAISLPALLVYLLPMTMAGAVSATILTSTLTKKSSLADAGSVLGLDMGVGTAARVVAPTLGTWLLSFNLQAVGGVAAAMAAVSWWAATSKGVWEEKETEVKRPVEVKQL